MISIKWIFFSSWFCLTVGEPSKIIRHLLALTSMPEECGIIGVDIKSYQILYDLSNSFPRRIQLFTSEGLLGKDKTYMSGLNEYNGCYFVLLGDLASLNLIDKFALRIGLRPCFVVFFEEETLAEDWSYPRSIHQPLIIFKQDSDPFYHLHLTCIYTNYRFNSKKVELWKEGKGFVFDKLNFDDHCRSSVIGLDLRVDYVAFTPFIMGVEELVGVDISMVKILAEKYKFTPIFQRNAAWGTYSDITNQSTGMIKTLREDKADFGISTPGISYYRHLAVRYTSSVYRQTIDYMCTKPKPIESYLNIVRPFTSWVWFCIFTSTLFMGTLLLIYYKIFKHLGKEFVIANAPWTDFYILTVVHLVEQGIMGWFKTWSSGRILTLTWNLFRTILIMAYCCNLRAVIIAREYTKPVDTGYDILKQDRPVYLFGNALPTTLLKTSEFDVHKKILKQFTGTYHYLNKEGKLEYQIYEDVNEKDGCILFLGILVKAATKDLIKDFDTMPYRFARNPFGFYHVGYIAQMENSPWMIEFANDILNLVQTGIPEKLMKEHLPREAYMETKDTRIIGGLALNHFITTYMLLVFGILLSSVIFATEIRRGKRQMISIE